jgi:transposase
VEQMDAMEEEIAEEAGKRYPSYNIIVDELDIRGNAKAMEALAEVFVYTHWRSWRMIRNYFGLWPRVGRPRADDRMVLNGILYVLTTGCRWYDMPVKYGSYKTAWRRLKRWEEMGIWDGIFKALASMRDHSRVSVDSTTISAKKGG